MPPTVVGPTYVRRRYLGSDFRAVERHAYKHTPSVTRGEQQALHCVGVCVRKKCLREYSNLVRIKYQYIRVHHPCPRRTHNCYCVITLELEPLSPSIARPTSTTVNVQGVVYVPLSCPSDDAKFDVSLSQGRRNVSSLGLFLDLNEFRTRAVAQVLYIVDTNGYLNCQHYYKLTE